MISDLAAKVGSDILERQRQRHEREMSRLVPRVVADPRIPVGERRLLAYRFDRAVPAGRTPQEPQKRYRPPDERLDTMVGGFLVSFSLGVFVLLMSLMSGAWVVGLWIFAGLTAFLVLFFGYWTLTVMLRETIPVDRAARAHHGRYLMPEVDLRPTRRRILERVFRATKTIRSAAVFESGRLQPGVTEERLEWWEWWTALFLFQGDAASCSPACCTRCLARAVEDIEELAERVTRFDPAPGELSSDQKADLLRRVRRIYPGAADTTG